MTINRIIINTICVLNDNTDVFFLPVHRGDLLFVLKLDVWEGV